MIDIETKNKITKMWEEGFTGGEIASLLKITRNTVMGFLYRVKKGGRVFERTQIEKPPAEKTKKVALKKYTNKEITFSSEDETMEFKNIRLFDLSLNTCRYIVSEIDGIDTLYCGNETTKRPYCQHHHRICYKRTPLIKV